MSDVASTAFCERCGLRRWLCRGGCTEKTLTQIATESMKRDLWLRVQLTVLNESSARGRIPLTGLSALKTPDVVYDEDRALDDLRARIRRTRFLYPDGHRQ